MYQEGQVLTALRNCAGALLDLCEGSEATPYGSTGSNPGGGKNPEIGGWPLEPGKEDEPKKEAEEPGEDKKEGGKKPGKDKKKAKRKERVAKKKKKKSPSPKEASGSKEGPGGKEESGKASPERSESLEDRPELKRKRKAEVHVAKGPRYPERRETPSEEEERLGLSRIPVRGSVGRHLSAFTRHRHDEPPPEPKGPPPRRDQDEFEEYKAYLETKRREAGGRYFKEKGFAHWKRGRDHWKDNIAHK